MKKEPYFSKSQEVKISDQNSEQAGVLPEWL